MPNMRNQDVQNREELRLILGGEYKMDAMDAILSRRSIRKYTTEPVPEKLINELLEAAMSAPSSSNGQPWHFVVIDDRRILNEIP